ncbi:MAG TPA: hypothetical protein VJC08_00455 [bacterium]|nr:hypothetical protein [bacterium]
MPGTTDEKAPVVPAADKKTAIKPTTKKTEVVTNDTEVEMDTELEVPVVAPKPEVKKDKKIEEVTKVDVAEPAGKKKTELKTAPEKIQTAKETEMAAPAQPSVNTVNPQTAQKVEQLKDLLENLSRLKGFNLGPEKEKPRRAQAKNSLAAVLEGVEMGALIPMGTVAEIGTQNLKPGDVLLLGANTIFVVTKINKDGGVVGHYYSPNNKQLSSEERERGRSTIMPVAALQNGRVLRLSEIEKTSTEKVTKINVVKPAAIKNEKVVQVKKLIAEGKAFEALQTIENLLKDSSLPADARAELENSRTKAEASLNLPPIARQGDEKFKVIDGNGKEIVFEMTRTYSPETGEITIEIKHRDEDGNRDGYARWIWDQKNGRLYVDAAVLEGALKSNKKTGQEPLYPLIAKEALKGVDFIVSQISNDKTNEAIDEREKNRQEIDSDFLGSTVLGRAREGFTHKLVYKKDGEGNSVRMLVSFRGEQGEAKAEVWSAKVAQTTVAQTTSSTTPTVIQKLENAKQAKATDVQKIVADAEIQYKEIESSNLPEEEKNKRVEALRQEAMRKIQALPLAAVVAMDDDDLLDTWSEMRYEAAKEDPVARDLANLDMAEASIYRAYRRDSVDDLIETERRMNLLWGKTSENPEIAKRQQEVRELLEAAKQKMVAPATVIKMADDTELEEPVLAPKSEVEGADTYKIIGEEPSAEPAVNPAKTTVDTTKPVTPAKTTVVVEGADDTELEEQVAAPKKVTKVEVVEPAGKKKTELKTAPEKIKTAEEIEDEAMDMLNSYQAGEKVSLPLASKDPTQDVVIVAATVVPAKKGEMVTADQVVVEYPVRQADGSTKSVRKVVLKKELEVAAKLESLDISLTQDEIKDIAGSKSPLEMLVKLEEILKNHPEKKAAVTINGAYEELNLKVESAREQVESVLNPVQNRNQKTDAKTPLQKLEKVQKVIEDVRGELEAILEKHPVEALTQPGPVRQKVETLTKALGELAKSLQRVANTQAGQKTVEAVHGILTVIAEKELDSILSGAKKTATGETPVEALAGIVRAVKPAAAAAKNNPAAKKFAEAAKKLQGLPLAEGRAVSANPEEGPKVQAASLEEQIRLDVLAARANKTAALAVAQKLGVTAEIRAASLAGETWGPLYQLLFAMKNLQPVVGKSDWKKLDIAAAIREALKQKEGKEGPVSLKGVDFNIARVWILEKLKSNDIQLSDVSAIESLMDSCSSCMVKQAKLVSRLAGNDGLAKDRIAQKSLTEQIAILYRFAETLLKHGIEAGNYQETLKTLQEVLPVLEKNRLMQKELEGKGILLTQFQQMIQQLKDSITARQEIEKKEQAAVEAREKEFEDFRKSVSTPANRLGTEEILNRLSSPQPFDHSFDPTQDPVLGPLMRDMFVKVANDATDPNQMHTFIFDFGGKRYTIQRTVAELREIIKPTLDAFKRRDDSLKGEARRVERRQEAAAQASREVVLRDRFKNGKVEEIKFEGGEK